MAGVSDLPFRIVTRGFGCPFAFTEMVDARAIAQSSKRTKRILTSSDGDKPLGIQILARSPEDLPPALDRLEGREHTILDFNAACPTPKIVRKGAGAALLKDPVRFSEILKVLVARSRVPVTVKIRAGWDRNSVNARDMALRARDAGVAGLFIHGRTREQGYGGRVDYRVIGEVKAALDIPVIASGDGLNPSLVRRMFAETGCDGVAIARGALGNPWIFPATRLLLERDQVAAGPTVAERVDVMRGHLRLLADYYGERSGVAVFRKFFTWYTRGVRAIRDLRDTAFRTTTMAGMLHIIDELLDSR